MSRLEIPGPDKGQLVVEELYKDLERRIESSPPGLCPVDMTRAFIEMCQTQSCGKCTPCRVGLWQLKNLLTDVMNGTATMETLDLIDTLSESIREGSDCPIGYEAGAMVHKSLRDCREDYEEHVRQGRCTCHYTQPVPCVSLCPAHVDIPGYIALTGEGRYADAIRLIRKDNPFPTTCGFICEHPCEARCRRNIVDDAINIRGLKRMAADYAGKVPPPECAPSTGKRIAVVGGGPGGLSAAYYLQLMGHQTTVFEMLPKLGGMLRYGIPNYRLPKDRLDEDIQAILETGVQVEFGKRIGKDITIQSLRQEYDAVLISIGASTDKKLGIEGEHAEGVISAVSFLRDVGEDKSPDLTGQEVAVIGGGNSALEEAMYLATLCKKVHLIVRRDVFRADKIIQDRLLKSENIEVHFKRKPAEILEEDNKVKGLTTDDGAEYEFDVVVDCTGPWSKITGEMVGLNVPIWHTKAEAFFLCPPGKKLDYTFPVLKYPEFYALRAGDNIFICKSHLSMDLNNPMHAGQWDPDKLPATGGTDDYFIDFLLEFFVQFP